MVHVKRVSLILFVLLNTHLSFSQKTEMDSLKKRVKDCADEMGNAFVTKNYEMVIKYMEPNTVEKLGGKGALIELFKKGLPGGAEIKSVEISNPSDTIISKGEIQCTLVETIKLKTKDGTISTTSTLIGISKDTGKNWYFIDANRPFDQLKRSIQTLVLDW